MAQAWVRPKHPKRKVVPDHSERNKLLLQYLSGKRARPNPSRIDRPQVSDPTLQTFAQHQRLDPTLQDFARHQAVAPPHPPPRSERNKPESVQSSHRSHQHQEPVAVVVTYQPEPEEMEYEAPISPPTPRRRIAERYDYGYASEIPPKPRILSRPPPKMVPRRTHRDWESPERNSWEERSTTSSRWASAITPLPGLV